MADKLEGDASSGSGRSVPLGRGRTAAPKPDTSKPRTAKPKRKAETPTLTDDLTGKFLRVGNKLYRTSDDKKPIARLEPDRLKTRNIDALPDIVRIAKANGWTSIRINGGDTPRSKRRNQRGFGLASTPSPFDILMVAARRATLQPRPACDGNGTHRAPE